MFFNANLILLVNLFNDFCFGGRFECSDFNCFHQDVTFLFNFFTENAYPTFLFYKVLRLFLNDKFEPKSVSATVEKDVKYVKLPFVGQCSYDVRKNLQSALKYSFPQIRFQFVFVNLWMHGGVNLTPDGSKSLLFYI